jgi:hypothetical protein
VKIGKFWANGLCVENDDGYILSGDYNAKNADIFLTLVLNAKVQVLSNTDQRGEIDYFISYLIKIR